LVDRRGIWPLKTCSIYPKGFSLGDPVLPGVTPEKIPVKLKLKAVAVAFNYLHQRGYVIVVVSLFIC